MVGAKPKINVEKIREKNQEYNLKEKAHLAMLATEMNQILLDKIKVLEEDKLFKDRGKTRKSSSRIGKRT